MKNILIVCIIVFGLLIVVASCATKPDTTDEESSELNLSELKEKANKKQGETAAIKKKADDIKANVAMKEDYEAADAVYKTAKSENKAGNYEQAIKLFDETSLLFEDVYKKTKAKKEKAEKSMEESKKELEILE